MSLNSLSPGRAGGKRWLGRLVTLACLAALVLGFNHWLGQRQNQDLSFCCRFIRMGGSLPRPPSSATTARCCCRCEQWRK